MSASLRRVLHQCADMIADAIEDHARDESSAPVKKSRRKRGPSQAPTPPLPAKFDTPEFRQRVSDQLHQRGLV